MSPRKRLRIPDTCEKGEGSTKIATFLGLRSSPILSSTVSGCIGAATARTENPRALRPFGAFTRILNARVAARTGEVDEVAFSRFETRRNAQTRRIPSEGAMIVDIVHCMLY
eukprot:8715521-Pyramimonas_sp.AAC.1